MTSAHTTSQPGILCAGSIVVDTLVRPFAELHWGTTTFVDELDRHLGGNGANTARALALLGNHVRLLGSLGNDDGARFCLKALQRAGVDTTWLHRTELPNAATVVLVHADGNRQFLHRLGSSEASFSTRPNFSEALHHGIRHLHLASLFVLPHLRQNAPKILSDARTAGLSTSLDTNWDARGEWLEVLEPCLAHTDVLFLNEDESFMLTGTRDAATAARFLQARGASVVVQKLSKAGCAIYSPGEASPVVCAAFPVTAVDSTGAGDCFAAGFLSEFLRGSTLRQAGMLGNAAGARSVSRIGATAGLLPLHELRLWMGEQQPPPCARQPRGASDLSVWRSPR